MCSMHALSRLELPWFLLMFFIYGLLFTIILVFPHLHNLFLFLMIMRCIQSSDNFSSAQILFVRISKLSTARTVCMLRCQKSHNFDNFSSVGQPLSQKLKISRKVASVWNNFITYLLILRYNFLSIC